MPVSNSSLRNPDSFIMNEDTVNISVCSFLKNKGVECDSPLVGKQRGVDVKGIISGYTILVESKGSQSNGLVDDTVFKHGQIVNHLARQLHTLMRYAETTDPNETLLILANPDIPRIRSEVDRVRTSINRLGLICFWVQENGNILIESEGEQSEILRKLRLIM